MGIVNTKKDAAAKSKPRPNDGSRITSSQPITTTPLDGVIADDLGDLLQRLTRDPRTSFGTDINEAELVLLGNAPVELKTCTLMQWLARNSPCMFARLGARRQKAVDFPICWLGPEDLDRGALYVQNVIQNARHTWKEGASDGLSSAFLVMFNDLRLARAKPNATFVELLCMLGRLYFAEKVIIQPNVIYTEAVPLVTSSGSALFRAGANFFYPTAHETRNHDRRVPGGVLLSINSPGHLANSWVARGLAVDLEAATADTRKLAIYSVGKGGMGSPSVTSCSWHNMADGRASDQQYSAIYHTDVLVPSQATIELNTDDAQIWNDLKLDYISTKEVPMTHPNYALYRGHPITLDQLFENPWRPRNSDTLEDIHT